MRVPFLTLAAAVLLQCSATAVQAGPACPPRPIVVGLYEYGLFYHAGRGIDKDVVAELGKRSGCAFEPRVMARRLIWQGLQDGSVDMTLSAAATPERLAFAWAEPYIWVQNKVVLHKDVSPRIRSTADFLASPNLRLGVGRGFAPSAPYADFVAQLRNLGRVEDIDDADRMFAMFKAGRFQAVLGSQLVYGGYLKDELITRQVRVEDWSQGKGRVAAHILLSKKSFKADDAQRWGELVKDALADGTMLQLVSRYVARDDAAKMLAPP